jgi:hypothetical protein
MDVTYGKHVPTFCRIDISCFCGAGVLTLATLPCSIEHPEDLNIRCKCKLLGTDFSCDPSTENP